MSFIKNVLKIYQIVKSIKKNNELASQITLSILKKASQYEKERIDKYKKENPYEVSTPTKERDLPKNQ